MGLRESGAFLMEAVGGKVLYEGLADGLPFLVKGLEAKLPEQVFLEGLGTGNRAFDEHALGIVVGAGPGGEARVRAVRVEVAFLGLAITVAALGKGLEGDGRTVFHHLEGRVGVELLLDLFLELLDRKGHELDGLDHLGAEALALFRDKRGLLELQSFLHAGIESPQWS